MKVLSTPSIELLEAQARLSSLRDLASQGTQAQSVSDTDIVKHDASLLQQGQAMLFERRRREAWEQGERASDALRENPSERRVPSTSHLDMIAPSLPTAITRKAISTDKTVKVYPDIAIGMLDAGLAAPGRIYWLMRFMDQSGRGCLDIAVIRQRLTSKDSSLRMCGWRRLRQLLNQGEGIFWKRDGYDRIWVLGARRIGENLSVSRFAGNPVSVPVSALLGGIKTVRAHFYASFHSGRKRSNPISREILRHLTSVPERTQQDYDQVARVGKQKNISVGEKFIDAEVENRAWKQGRAVFHFVDVQGKQGPAGREYIAWHLPNSYTGPHVQCSKGRRKKINQQLVDLVMKGMRGNDRAQVEKVFWPNGAAAAKVYTRSQSNDAYWQRGQTRGKSFILWYVLPGEVC